MSYQLVLCVFVPCALTIKERQAIAKTIQQLYWILGKARDAVKCKENVIVTFIEICGDKQELIRQVAAFTFIMEQINDNNKYLCPCRPYIFTQIFTYALHFLLVV